jgi:hypothetical protein
MDNFNLKKFLVENKLTTISRNVNEATQEELTLRVKSFLNNDAKYEIIDVDNVNNPEKYLDYNEKKVMYMPGYGNQKTGVTIISTNNPEHVKMLQALIQKVGVKSNVGNHKSGYKAVMFKDDSLEQA